MIAKGQITIVDSNDSVNINTWLEAPNFHQVLSGETFLPDFTEENLVITPKVYVSGDTSNQITAGNVANIVWKVAGITITDSQHGDFDAFISNDSAHTLTIKKNLVNSSSVSIEFEGDYVDEFGIKTKCYAQKDLSRTTNGEGAFTCYLTTGSTGNAIEGSDEYIDIYAQAVRGSKPDNTDIQYDWYHRDENGWKLISEDEDKNQYVTTDDNHIRIYADFIDNVDTIRCVVTDIDEGSPYYGNTAEEVLTIFDYTEPYSLDIISYTGDKLTKAAPSTTLEAVLRQGDKELVGASLIDVAWKWDGYDKMGNDLTAWETKMINAGKLHTQKVDVTKDDISVRATFMCTATIGKSSVDVDAPEADEEASESSN